MNCVKSQNCEKFANQIRKKSELRGKGIMRYKFAIARNSELWDKLAIAKQLQGKKSQLRGKNIRRARKKSDLRGKSQTCEINSQLRGKKNRIARKSELQYINSQLWVKYLFLGLYESRFYLQYLIICFQVNS